MIMRWIYVCFVATWPIIGLAQQVSSPPATVIPPGDNFVLENIPPIPSTIAADTARYGDFRSSTFFDWHPTRREILIGTRFGDINQVHSVAMPMGARRQLTFSPDHVRSAQYLRDEKSFLFQTDAGGSEWYQIYRYNFASGDTTLLTDGHSRNEYYLLAHHNTKLVYTSTQRNNKDDDLWLLDVSEAPSNEGHSAARLLLQVQGGGWQPVAWSPDNRYLLVLESISANESYLWLVDAINGDKRPLTARSGSAAAGSTVAYTAAVFSGDGKSIYVLGDRNSEFQRLAKIDLETLGSTYITSSIPWDIEEMALSDDGKWIAYIANENAYSKLYAFDTATGKKHTIPNVPVGVIQHLHYRPNSHELAFEVASARSPSDVYSVDTDSGSLERWTHGETGALNPARFAEPTLIQWKSFDGLELGGFLYQPDAAKFPGPRPVIVEIHGGPEAQFRPDYIGRLNYLINVLGVSVLAPNVRGSTGYGKTFLKLDDGFHRDDAYRDINALLDWVRTQPSLDAERVMVHGGSYGGHMAWAVSAFYNDRIRCAMPVFGMSNLVTFLEHTEAYRRDLRRVEYGDERDPAMRAYLEKIAPMNHLNAMRKPVFAVVGKNDPRVPWTESRQIIDKLIAQGTPTWFMMANDEGHGYAKKKNRDFLFDAEVLFINQCLLDKQSN